MAFVAAAILAIVLLLELDNSDLIFAHAGILTTLLGFVTSSSKAGLAWPNGNNENIQ